MNTTELALLEDWNEQELAAFVAEFVRRERRLPGYPDFTDDRATVVALV
jgi:hypothetical protein